MHFNNLLIVWRFDGCPGFEGRNVAERPCGTAHDRIDIRGVQRINAHPASDD
jgi:hypothetical protein